MLAKVNKLFEAIRPIRLAQDLGFTVHKHKKGSYFIDNPKANQKHLYIKDYEFVNPDKFGDFKAGNIISFMSYVSGKSFEESMEYIFKFYFNRLESPIFDSLQWSKRLISEYLEDLDLLLSLVHRNKSKLVNNPEFSTCRTYLRKYCDDLNYISTMVSVVDEQELYDTLQQLKSLHKLKINTERHYSRKSDSDKNNKLLLLPTFANYSTISDIQVINPEFDRPRSLDVTPYNRGVFGLHAVDPSETCVYVVRDEFSALGSAKNHFNHGSPVSQNCVSIKMKKEGNYLPPLLSQGLMVIDESTSADVILGIHNSFQELGLVNKNQLFKATFDQSRDARTYVLNQFLTLVSQGSLEDVKFEEFIEVLKEDPITLDRVRLHLEHTQRADILALLESSAARSEINTINGNTIITTKDGYVAQNVSRNVHFTNFTIKLQTTHIFRDSSDVYHSGIMTMDSQQLSFIMSKKDSTKATSIVSAAIQSLTSSTVVIDDCSNIQTPALLDTTFGITLRNIINKEINNSIVKLGVNKLGWSSDRSRFQSTSWACTGGDVESKISFCHPRVKSFLNFDWSFKKIGTKEIIYNSPGTNAAVALVSGMLGRSFLNLASPPVLVKNTKENRLILATALHIFGQKQTEEINPNIRNEVHLAGLDGYPMVCACPNDSILPKLRFPTFVLAEEGYSFADESIDYKSFSDFCNFYFPHLINEMLRSKGANLDPNYSSSEFIHLLTEGLAILRQSMPSVNWQVTLQNHGIFGQWMSRIPIEDFHKIVSMDFKAQEVRIHTAGIEKLNIDIVKVGNYMSQKNLNVRRKNHYFIMRAEDANRMLADIFIEPPKLGTYTTQPTELDVQKQSNDVRTG